MVHKGFHSMNNMNPKYSQFKYWHVVVVSLGARVSTAATRKIYSGCTHFLLSFALSLLTGTLLLPPFFPQLKKPSPGNNRSEISAELPVTMSQCPIQDSNVTF